MSQRIQAAHVDQKHVENFFSIQQAFDLYAARAQPRRRSQPGGYRRRTRARQEDCANEKTFTLRQVVLILSNTASPAAIGEAAKKMEGLRARFTDCDGGTKIATEFRRVRGARADHPDLVAARRTVGRASRQDAARPSDAAQPGFDRPRGDRRLLAQGRRQRRRQGSGPAEDHAAHHQGPGAKALRGDARPRGDRQEGQDHHFGPRRRFA